MKWELAVTAQLLRQKVYERILSLLCTAWLGWTLLCGVRSSFDAATRRVSVCTCRKLDSQRGNSCRLYLYNDFTIVHKKLLMRVAITLN